MTMTIGKRILLGFGVVVALSAGLGWFALNRLYEVYDVAARIADRDFQVSKLNQEIQTGQDRVKVLWERTVATFAMRKKGVATPALPASFDELRRAFEKPLTQLRQLESLAAGYENSAASRQHAALWGRVRQTAGEAFEAIRALAAEDEAEFALLQRDAFEELAARQPVLDRLRDTFDLKIDAVGTLTAELVELGKAEAATAYQRAIYSILAAVSAVLLVGVAASLLIHRSIARPLAAFVQFASRVGQGDLTQQVVVAGQDELGVLGRSLNEMVGGLRNVAGQTRIATENLNSAAAEILASTQQQATSAAEQAAALQQTTATMQQVTQSGAQIAERARQVASGSEVTGTASKSGIQAVESMTRAMDAIREQAEAVAENIVTLSEKTQAVGEIIATVNEIAEQSNLLALNAAIGAAAAGEQGRGFSVVANEMKSLADQAKSATVQVRSILGDIQKGINSSVMLTEEAVKRVESGKQQADIAEQTIRHMGDSIELSVRAFQQIMAATNQQQIGFDQVAQALKNISTATGQTAAGTRQLEAAAANVNVLGQQLLKATERYRI